MTNNFENAQRDMDLTMYEVSLTTSHMMGTEVHTEAHACHVDINELELPDDLLFDGNTFIDFGKSALSKFSFN